LRLALLCSFELVQLVFLVDLFEAQYIFGELVCVDANLKSLAGVVSDKQRQVAI